MPRKRLTELMIGRLPAPKQGQTEFYDVGMPGFMCRVSYSGTRSWAVMTRVDGKLVRVTIGEWPTLGLAAAHAAAREIKQQAKAGVDPRIVRRELQAETRNAQRMTFGRLADEFLEKYARPKLRQRTVEEYHRALKGDRVQEWQGRPIASISRRDVLQLLDGLTAEGKQPTARLVTAYLRKFFKWCAERDLIEQLPTERLRIESSRKARDRALSVNELRRVWQAADNLGGTAGGLIKMLMLTGQRRFETSVMRRRNLSNLNGDAPLWALPSSVTKNRRPHQVPLVPMMVDIIAAQPVLGAEDANTDDTFVFTTNGRTPFSGWSKAKKALDKFIAQDGGPPMDAWTLHDLRRSLVTGMNELGYAQPHVIESIVNHVSGLKGGIAGVYNRATYMDERRRALVAWAKLVSGEALVIHA